MAMFGFEFNNLNDVLVEQLQDLYDTEQRLTSALPKMAEAAHSQQLAEAFRQHERVTEEHVRRLEDVFNRIGCKPDRITSQGMKGLIDDGEKIAKSKGDPSACDAALIAAAQRVEHYEMAGYGTARTCAQQLGLQDVAKTLQQTLDEEGMTDKKLTQIAESNINVQATH